MTTYNIYLRKNNGEVRSSYIENTKPGIILSQPVDENGREILETSKGLIKKLSVDELTIKIETQ